MVVWALCVGGCMGVPERREGKGRKEEGVGAGQEVAVKGKAGSLMLS